MLERSWSQDCVSDKVLFLSTREVDEVSDEEKKKQITHNTIVGNSRDTALNEI